MRRLCLLLTGVCLLACEASLDDTVLYHDGRIYTADPAMPWAEAMVIRDGRLDYVGSNEDATANAGQDAYRYNLKSRLVLPGLIDSHTHPGFIAKFNGLLPLPEADSREAQMKDIAKLLAANPDKELIHAIGWDNRFFGTDGPHRRDLDALDDSRPILIWDITMHSLWVNTKTLEVTGITRDVVDPIPGVAYFKRDAEGELTGYITESAATNFSNKIVGMGEEEEITLQAFLDYLRDVGVTTLFDAGNFGGDDAVYAAVSRLDRAGALPLRYHGAYTLFLPQQYDTAVAELKKLGERYNSDRVRIDTLKIFLDGVIETRSAHLLKDYDDMPGHRGGSLLTQEQIRELILALDREGLNLHVHTIGDEAVRRTLDAVAAARESLGRAPRTRIAMTHLQVVSPEDYARFAELGIIAQYTPAWHGYDLPFYEDALGERAQHPYPVRPLLERGAMVSYSSDVYFPSEWHDGSASPFTGIQVGHRRQYREDAPDGPRSGPADEQLTLEELIDGYTRGGAWQLGREKELGSLTAGKQADFIVLDTDLFSMNPAEIHTLKPSLVVIGGEPHR